MTLKNPTRLLTTTAILLSLGLSGCTTTKGILDEVKSGLTSKAANDNAPELSAAKVHWGDEEKTEAQVPVKLASLSQTPVLTLRATPTLTKLAPRTESEARDMARIKPRPSDYLNGIQVYPFKRGAIYQVYAAPEQVTDIALEPGEELISASAGDTVRWMVGDTSSGSQTGKQAHILIKPLAADISTNLIILTSKRTYYLELQARGDSYMAGVTWRYADDLMTAMRPRSFAKPVKMASRETDISRPATPAEIPALENLDFAYRVKGDKPDWRPVRVFDDGHKVFIQFPETISRSEAPPLFVKSDSGKSALVNYRVKGRYYIVDRLFEEAELRLGEKKQQVVRIIRDTKS